MAFAQNADRYLLQLRSAWAAKILSGKKIEAESLRRPFRGQHPVAEVLSSLIARETEVDVPPLREEVGLLSLGDLCQLAILRDLAGEDGEILGKSLLPFCPFPTLWSRESQYNGKEAEASIDLVQAAFGKDFALSADVDPYFLALEKRLPNWRRSSSDRKGGELFEGKEIASRLGLVKNGNVATYALAFKGKGTSLGVIRAGSVEISAFGPQVHPLNDPHLFGIYTSDDPSWMAVNAEKEVWFQLIPSFETDTIDVRFIGISPQVPISFVFYVKADFVRLDQDVYFPKSLRRYGGDAKRLILEKGNHCLSIENRYPGSLELIPLAGEKCFWGADFLIGFQIPSHEGRALFHFS